MYTTWDIRSEVHYDLDQLLDQIRELFKKEDRPAISLLFNWLQYLYQNRRITEADFEQLNQVYYDEGEVSMLIQSIRNERRTLQEERRTIMEERSKLLQQIQLERSEGKLEGKLEIERSMLHEGLEIDFIVKVTQLAREEIEKLKY